MKKLYTLLAVAFITISAFAQSPEQMSYQAIIRNNSNELVANQLIGMQVSVLYGSASGTAVYVELHTPATNSNGLVSIEIGAGITQSGNFAAIDWANGPYFIKTETDPTGGSTYSITGISQLLSVPYALHAKTAELVIEVDPVYSASEAANITAGDITNLSNLSGINTGDQDMSGIDRNAQAIKDTAAQIRSDIPDVNGFISTEVDPVYVASEAANITAEDITNLDNLSGINTGDQDITGIGMNTQAIMDTAAQIRSDIPDVSGFISTEVDPVYSASKAASITADDITNLSNLSGTNTGDQDITGIGMNTQAIMDTAAQIRADIPDVSGFISTEVDPVYAASEAASITADDITNLSNLSGTNTGDQDITGIGMNTQAIWDTAAQIRADIPDVSGFISTEVDPVYAASEASNITADDITNLDSLSGKNTGDQDLSNLATITALGDSTAQVRSEIPEMLSGTLPGQMQYWNGTSWVAIAAGNEGQVLTFSNGVPKWKGELVEGEVENPITGKIWLDKNLGATQVATSSTDAAAYGDLYQWGRGSDGHQSRTSWTTSQKSSTDQPGHAGFIVAQRPPYDWRSPQNTNLWQGVNGVNNPCPSGYRLPTDAEWQAERASWSSNNSAGAFASPLKLPAAGNRSFTYGHLEQVGSGGYYWSSTSSSSRSCRIYFYISNATAGNLYRAAGLSVRCIKN